MSAEYNAAHNVFVFMAVGLLVTAAVNYNTSGLGLFIVSGFLIYCMAAIMSGLRQGEADTLQKHNRANRRKRQK